MKLKSTVIKNYRGIKEETLVSFQDFNCIVGKNDVGKSTLLKAIDAFLNENNPNIEDKNVYSDSIFMEINLIFDSASSLIILDDTIPVSLFDEELVDENGLISVKKVWDVSQKTIKPKIFLCRKIYDADDFVMLSEKELRTLCAKFHIETAKANGLKPYEYFEYLLTEIPKHQDESSKEFLADLLPWSEKLPEYIRKPKKARQRIKQRLRAW